MKLILAFFFYSLMISAQINVGAFDDYVYFVNQNKTEYAEIAGSPYVTKEFVPAYINDRKDVVYVRFNTYANQIEFKKADGEIVILSIEQDYRFKILDSNNTEFEIHYYLNDAGKKIKTFFKKLYASDKFSLYSKQEVDFKPAKIATSGYEKDKQATFITGSEKFYIRAPSMSSGVLLKVPQRRKELSEFFEGQGDRINSFIKKEKIKLDDYENLIELFNFYFQ